MNALKKISLGAAGAICAAALATGCTSEQAFMGNTAEAMLEEGDVFAVISVMDYGDITIKLFPEAAPEAVKRFITLAENNYYDGRTFHRVVKDQLIQGGSLTGSGFDGEVSEQEYFDVETSKYMCHYYGALCMAKSDNGNYCQFYIVNNSEPVDIDSIAESLRADLDNSDITSAMTEEDLEYYEAYYKKLNGIADEIKERYAQVGGIYDLDGEDTVFGQVIDGWDVLAAINQVETVYGNTSDDRNDIPSKPIIDIVIEKVEVIHITPAETTTTEKTRTSRTTTESVETSDSTEADDTDTVIVNDSEIITTGTAEEAEPVETDDAEESSGDEESTEAEDTEESSGEDSSEGDGTEESSNEQADDNEDEGSE